jgi:hypothetical protein
MDSMNSFCSKKNSDFLFLKVFLKSVVVSIEALLIVIKWYEFICRSARVCRSGGRALRSQIVPFSALGPMGHKVIKIGFLITKIAHIFLGGSWVLGVTFLLMETGSGSKIQKNVLQKCQLLTPEMGSRLKSKRKM